MLPRILVLPTFNSVSALTCYTGTSGSEQLSVCGSEDRCINMTDTTLTGVPEYGCYLSSNIVAPSYVDGKCTVLDNKEICICEKDQCNKGGKCAVYRIDKNVGYRFLGNVVFCIELIIF